MPERVQLRRKTGWRMPPNTVSVARPTCWGNPFRIEKGPSGYSVRYIPTGLAVGDSFTRPDAERYAVEAFREFLGSGRLPIYEDGPTVEELRGKDLACWCDLDRPCHADVLLEIANA